MQICIGGHPFPVMTRVLTDMICLYGLIPYV